jgi:hypothetical protein
MVTSTSHNPMGFHGLIQDLHLHFVNILHELNVGQKLVRGLFDSVCRVSSKSALAFDQQIFAVSSQWVACK